MEKVVRNICLDSDSIIELLNGNKTVIGLIDSLEADFYTTVINVFEIWTGRKDEENISELLEWTNIVEFNKEAAMLAGDIRKELRKKGLDIDIRDLFIASICIINKLDLLTYNKKHFERLESFGLKLI